MPPRGGLGQTAKPQRLTSLSAGALPPTTTQVVVVPFPISDWEAIAKVESILLRQSVPFSSIVIITSKVSLSLLLLLAVLLNWRKKDHSNLRSFRFRTVDLQRILSLVSYRARPLWIGDLCI